jgi:hypothetical protein
MKIFYKFLRLISKVITYFGFKFNAIQYNLGRRIYGGDFYKIEDSIPNYEYWTDNRPKKGSGEIIRKRKHYK